MHTGTMYRTRQENVDAICFIRYRYLFNVFFIMLLGQQTSSLVAGG